MPTAYNVSQAAAVIGASPSTVRNWCKQYGAHLSPGASPRAGAERILTPGDVATLQHIKTQRDALKDYDMIVAELAAMPPGAALQPYIDVTATPTPQEAPQSPAGATMPGELVQALQVVADVRYNDLQRQIDAANGAMADRLQWLVLGIGIGVLLTLASAGLVWLGWAAR